MANLSSDDEVFLLIEETKQRRKSRAAEGPTQPLRRLKPSSGPRKHGATGDRNPMTPGSTGRRRRIGVIKENPLMRKWDGGSCPSLEIGGLSPDEAPPRNRLVSRTSRAQILKAFRLGATTEAKEHGDSPGDSPTWSPEAGGSVTSPVKRRTQPRRAAATKAPAYLEDSSEDKDASSSDDGSDITASARRVLGTVDPDPVALESMDPTTPPPVPGYSSAEDDPDRQIQDQLAEEMMLAARRVRSSSPTEPGPPVLGPSPEDWDAAECSSVFSAGQATATDPKGPARNQGAGGDDDGVSDDEDDDDDDDDDDEDDAEEGEDDDDEDYSEEVDDDDDERDDDSDSEFEVGAGGSDSDDLDLPEQFPAPKSLRPSRSMPLFPAESPSASAVTSGRRRMGERNITGHGHARDASQQ